jgi:hypothetical protein
LKGRRVLECRISKSRRAVCLLGLKSGSGLKTLRNPNFPSLPRRIGGELGFGT